MNKKLWYGIAALVVVAVGVVLVLVLTQNQDQAEIAIGAVLPLTGEAAAWGVPAKQGAELSRNAKRITLLLPRHRHGRT